MTPLPEIHGHRGARGLYPENSLPAIQAGIEHGCHGIEVDVCVTRDRQLVLHHDPVLSPRLVRDASGRWIDREIRIFELTFQELQQFDIGRIKPDTPYASRFSSQTSLDGTRIPNFDDFIALINHLKATVLINLELKNMPYDPGCTPEVHRYIDLVESALLEHQILDRVFLQSFDWRLVREAKRRMPGLKTGFITDCQSDGAPRSPIENQPSLWTANQDLADYGGSIADMVCDLGGDVWSSNYMDITAPDVVRAHELGLEVYVWTVNDLEQLKRITQFGVDVVTTDYPDTINPNNPAGI